MQEGPLEEFQVFKTPHYLIFYQSTHTFLRKLAKQKGYDLMPYYAVMFEQPLSAGLVRRAAMVSQSPSMIQQWVQEISNPPGGQANWQVLPHPTRAWAIRAVEEWMRGY